MQLQNTPYPPKTEYRGKDWQRIQDRGRRSSAAAATAAPADPADPRLGSSAYFVSYKEAVKAYPGPSHLVTLKRYDGNGAKLTYRTVHEAPTVPGQSIHESVAKPKISHRIPRAEADPFTVRKSAFRARAEIEDWVRMMCQPGVDYRLCTGTRRGGIADTRQCKVIVERFRRLLAVHYPDVCMVSVPELHKGGGVNHGTYHVHMVLTFPEGVRPLYTVFHRLWAKALGGTGKEAKENAPGNFDFAKTHGKDGKRFTACQAARYLSKYVTKDYLAGYVGEHRFTRSHGAPPPAKAYWWAPIALDRGYTRSVGVYALREFYPGESYHIQSRTFTDGGDTYHVFSAEPLAT